MGGLAPQRKTVAASPNSPSVKNSPQARAEEPQIKDMGRSTAIEKNGRSSKETARPDWITRRLAITRQRKVGSRVLTLRTPEQSWRIRKAGTVMLTR